MDDSCYTENYWYKILNKDAIISVKEISFSEIIKVSGT